jgi:hypothetical protein
MKLATSKDENGHGLLHKAVYYGHRDIVDWLIEKYPEALEVHDWVSNTKLEKVLCFQFLGQDLLVDKFLVSFFSLCQTGNVDSQSGMI